MVFKKIEHTGWASVLLIWVVLQLNCFAQTRICQIKYGTKSVENNNLIRGKTPLLQKIRKGCYQIGFEHNASGTKLPERPIFACCRPQR